MAPADNKPNQNAEFDISAPWQEALECVANSAARCLVIGPVDAGKSTFCLLATNYALRAGHKPACLDTDPGQSDIGPPAALGLALIDKPIANWSEAKTKALHFIGATSPVGHLLEISTGAVRLAECADKMGADLTIVNTTGLVQGGIARALKSAKIRLLNPTHIVSIAGQGETDAILASLKGRQKPQVFRLSPSPKAVSRDAETRRKRREQCFAEYFADAKEVHMPFSDTVIHDALWLSGKPLDGLILNYVKEAFKTKLLWAERTVEGAFFVVVDPPTNFDLESLEESFDGEIKVIEKSLLDNLLVGLTDREGEDMALGIIKAVDFIQQKVTLLVPSTQLNKPAGLRLGYMRVSPDGTELGGLPASIWG